MSFQVSLFSIVLLLVTGSLAQNYYVVKTWGPSAIDCSGVYNGFILKNNTNRGTCVNVNCRCVNGYCSTAQCGVTTVPDDPPNAAVNAVYVSDTGCTGEASLYVATTNGACSFADTFQNVSFSFSCKGGDQKQTSYASGNCTGNIISDISYRIGSGMSHCTYGVGFGALYYKCSGLCFHKDSNINYHGKDLSFSSLSSPQNDEPCTIPHVVKSDGVKISTTCEGVLRLTHEHLVMSNHGWRKAGNVQVGDKIYSTIHSYENECEVTKIETEKDQEYFGLNCEDSHVLANGYWVSTFGETHAIPATWMKVMSKIIGVRAASSIGDKIADFAARWSYLF